MRRAYDINYNTCYLTDKPVVDFTINTKQRFVQQSAVSLKCDVTGYPLPQVKWLFHPTANSVGEPIPLQGEDQVKSLYEVSSVLQIRYVNVSGNITCVASNRLDNSAVTQQFLVYEIQDGFGIKNLRGTWFPEHDSVLLTCVASKYEFSNVSWITDNGVDLHSFGNSCKYHLSIAEFLPFVYWR